MQSPKRLAGLSSGSFLLIGKLRSPVRLTAMATVVVLFSLTVACSLCKAGTGSLNAPIPQVAAAQDQDQFWFGTGVLLVIALVFAWLKLLTDFYQYRGLLPALLWSGYSWVFVVFIAALSFAFDYMVWKYWAHNINPHWFGHLSLALGHTGASAAFANTVPFLLSRIPALHHRHEYPSVERKPTEMNAVFAAIRESLDGRTNGKLTDWTIQYSWEEIKYTANTMRIDHENSKTITSDYSALLKSEFDRYTCSENLWEDRQKKYELLRRLMTHSSFRDLRTRLKQANRQGPAAAK